ncbi:MAG: hypothetical protein AB1758_04300 [Candidatus Eremiobacterota bacterium]
MEPQDCVLPGWSQVEPKKNGICHLRSGEEEMWRADNGSAVVLQGDAMQISMPDETLIHFDTRTGLAEGQTSGGTSLPVLVDRESKSLTYMGDDGRMWSFNPVRMTVILQDGGEVTRFDSIDAPPRSGGELSRCDSVTALPKDAVINPELGVTAIEVDDLYTQARGEQTVACPSGVIRTTTPDGLMVMTLGGTLVLSDGPAGTFALDHDKPLAPVRVLRRRADGSQEWMYTFRDSAENVWTCFSESLDVHVKGPHGASSMILPDGRIYSVHRNEAGRLLAGGPLPQVEARQTESRYPDSGHMLADFQEAYLSQRPARPEAGSN